MAVEPVADTVLPREGTPTAKPVTPQADPVAAAPEQWREEFKKTIEQRDGFKTQAKNQLDELTKLRQFFADVAAKDKATQDRLENEKLIEQGKFGELQAKKDAEHKKAFSDYQAKVQEKLIPDFIKVAASKIGTLTEQALEDLPTLLKGKLGIDTETLAIKVLGEDGKALKDATGNDVKPADFISDFAKGRPYLLRDGMPKSTGAVNGQNSQTAPQQALTKEEEDAWATRDPEGYKAHVASEFSPAKMVAAAKAKHAGQRVAKM